MEAVVAIVDGAFVRVAEDVVRGGDLGEAVAGVWVGAVPVWVVFEGEGVEFPSGMLVFMVSSYFPFLFA